MIDSARGPSEIEYLALKVSLSDHQFATSSSQCDLSIDLIILIDIGAQYYQGACDLIGGG